MYTIWKLNLSLCILCILFFTLIPCTCTCTMKPNIFSKKYVNNYYNYKSFLHEVIETQYYIDLKTLKTYVIFICNIISYETKVRVISIHQSINSKIFHQHTKHLPSSNTLFNRCNIIIMLWYVWIMFYQVSAVLMIYIPTAIMTIINYWQYKIGKN